MECFFTMSMEECTSIQCQLDEVNIVHIDLEHLDIKIDSEDKNHFARMFYFSFLYTLQSNFTI